MARAGRFTTLAPLPPHGEWRRALALDRAAAPPRPVVLSFVPPSVVDDPARLAALVRDVEAAAKLHHPAAVPVIGTETVGDALTVVEDFHPGATLRSLLDAGGRLPPDVAARIAVDLCAALARAHATDAGEGRMLAHGAVSASLVLVGEDGVSRLCGFGEGAGGDPAADLRALASVLHECLAGEPPGRTPAPFDAPGVPAPLAAAVDRALGAAPGAPFTSAASLGEAISAARLAAQADVAAYAEAILPAEEGGRGALRRALDRAAGDEAEEVSADLIVEPAGSQADLREPVLVTTMDVVAPTRELPRPPQTRPGVDPAGVFPAPAAAAPRSRATLVIAAAVLCGAAGFAIGLALSSVRLPPPPPPVASELAPATDGPAASAAPGTPGKAEAAAGKAKATGPAHGKAAKAKATRVAAEKVAPVEKGTLSVTAPDDAEVFLDGKKIGRGALKLEIAAGPHRLEVRRGDAKVGERFSVAANETWTYDVTPTP